MRHYVIFGSSNDYYRASYRDILEVEGARYLADFLPTRSKFLRKIHTAHCLTPFAVRKKLPLRKLWYKKYFREPYKDGDEYVDTYFVFPDQNPYFSVKLNNKSMYEINEIIIDHASLDLLNTDLIGSAMLSLRYLSQYSKKSQPFPSSVSSKFVVSK